MRALTISLQISHLLKGFVFVLRRKMDFLLFQIPSRSMLTKRQNRPPHSTLSLPFSSLQISQFKHTLILFSKDNSLIIISSFYVIGIPLPLIGMSAYGTVFLLGLTLGGWKLPVKIDETDGRLLLLSITSSMAVASAYFLYILSTQFGGASSCSYCLGSAIFSFSLFFIILKEFGLEELRKVVVLPLFTAAIALGVLGNSYGSLPPNSPRSEAVNIPYYETMITTESTPFTISLAKHLHSIGAKMYGAFWCTHCQEQKEMFGREAAKLLDYVECFPDGVKKGTSLIPACANIGIEGFPTWIINGEVLGGEKTIEELATLSGFQGDVISQPK